MQKGASALSKGAGENETDQRAASVTARVVNKEEQYAHRRGLLAWLSSQTTGVGCVDQGGTMGIRRDSSSFALLG